MWSLHRSEKPKELDRNQPAPQYKYGSSSVGRTPDLGSGGFRRFESCLPYKYNNMLYMIDFSNCKSLAEMGRLLGYNYYNANVKQKIIKVCNDNGIDPYKIIADNNKPKVCNICLYCGKEITGKGKYTKKFCNLSCSASFNNKSRKISDETKQKIQLSLLQKNSEAKKNEYIIRKCVVCGEEFRVFRIKNGKLSKAITCSETCRRDLISNSCKKAMDIVMSEGRHQGWKSRNIISYPEKFWMEVLSNNNIEYKHNYPFGKYFLDFYIEIDGRKIDLEIDGKQHKYEYRHNSDIIRDKFVNSQNIEVYRIDWNTINTEDGKRIMKEKIENFLKFIRQ